MKVRIIVASAAATLFLLAPRIAAAFCGFYVSGTEGKLFADASQVVMLREGTRTVLAMQNDYQGPPKDFAMVVPVPVVLQKENVKTLPKALRRWSRGAGAHDARQGHAPPLDHGRVRGRGPGHRDPQGHERP